MLARGIDYRSYQMSHCVSIAMIFVSAIFASATLTAKMALTAKMRGLHLLPKWRPTRVHKKSRTQFWLSDSSGIIYNLCPGVWVGGHLFCFFVPRVGQCSFFFALPPGIYTKKMKIYQYPGAVLGGGGDSHSWN